MKLIDDWKCAWKFMSVQGMTLAATTQLVWVGLPDDFRASVPSSVVTGITLACLVLGVFGRVVDQGITKK